MLIKRWWRKVFCWCLEVMLMLMLGCNRRGADRRKREGVQPNYNVHCAQIEKIVVIFLLVSRKPASPPMTKCNTHPAAASVFRPSTTSSSSSSKPQPSSRAQWQIAIPILLQLVCLGLLVLVSRNPAVLLKGRPNDKLQYPSCCS